MAQKVVMICGEPNTGKSTSLRNLKEREKFAYLNCDNKPLPIGGANAFLTNQDKIHNPQDLLSFYAQLESSDKCKGVILDSLTYMMAVKLRRLEETETGFDIWNGYAQFYNQWNDAVKMSNKTHIIMAHTARELNEQAGQMESRITMSGAVGKRGAEADQTLIVTSKQMPIGKLEAYQNDNLVITDRERIRGMKYVFSVDLIKEFVGDRTRAPMGFWKDDEIIIDNDIQIVLDRFDEFYGS